MEIQNDDRFVEALIDCFEQAWVALHRYLKTTSGSGICLWCKVENAVLNRSTRINQFRCCLLVQAKSEEHSVRLALPRFD